MHLLRTCAKFNSHFDFAFIYKAEISEPIEKEYRTKRFFLKHSTKAETAWQIARI